MSLLHPMRPTQLAAETRDGSLHRDFFRWLSRLGTIVNLWTPPPKSIIFAALTAGDITQFFDGTGLGNVGGSYEGWAICNGANDTPDLRNRFVRSVGGASGGTGGADSHTHGAGTLYAQHETAPGDSWINEVGGKSWNATATTTTPAWSADTSARTFGITVAGSSASADSRPAYHELVALMRVERAL